MNTSIMLNESFKRAFYRRKYYTVIGKYFINSSTPKWGKLHPTGFAYNYGRFLVFYLVCSALGAAFAVYFILSFLFGLGR